VSVCHRRGKKGFKTVTINSRALKAHMRHGDTLGACVEAVDELAATPEQRNAEEVAPTPEQPTTISSAEKDGANDRSKGKKNNRSR